MISFYDGGSIAPGGRSIQAARMSREGKELESMAWREYSFPIMARKKTESGHAGVSNGTSGPPEYRASVGLKKIIYMIVIFIRHVGGSIIKEVTIRVAEKDMEFVQGLENLGMNRNVALVITFLKDQNEIYFKDIEIATDLKQQKVSVDMQTLRERGWLKEHDIEGNRKGRRFRFDALKATIDEIINYYEAEKCRESARAMESIQRLKELTTV